MIEGREAKLEKRDSSLQMVMWLVMVMERNMRVVLVSRVAGTNNHKLVAYITENLLSHSSGG